MLGAGREGLRGFPKGIAFPWQLNLFPQLHLPNFIGSTGNPAAKATFVHPDGQSYSFKMISGGSWVPDSAALPKSQDYKLELNTGYSYPSDLNDMRFAPSEWRVSGPNDEVWIFRAVPVDRNASTLEYVVGLPIQRIDRDGYTWTYAYGANDELVSLTDSFGRQATFTWYQQYFTWLTPPPAAAAPIPLAIKEITLPDASVLRFSYDPPPLAAPPTSAPPFTDLRKLRLTKVERVSSGGTVLDSETYLY